VGAIVGGIIAALVVVGIIAIALLYARRKRSLRRTREEAALDSEPKPFVVESAALDEGRSHLDPPFSNLPSTSRSVTGTEIPQDLALRSPDVPIGPENVSSDSNPSPSSPRQSELSDRKQLIVLSPPLSSSSAAPAVGSTSIQPTGRELVASMANAQGVSTAELTNEQIDSVTRLLSTSVPATDVARVIERMKVAGEQGLASVDTSYGMGGETAPPGYDAIDS
jgi:hypothetical protein